MARLRARSCIIDGEVIKQRIGDGAYLVLAPGRSPPLSLSGAPNSSLIDLHHIGGSRIRHAVPHKLRDVMIDVLAIALAVFVLGTLVLIIASMAAARGGGLRR